MNSNAHVSYSLRRHTSPVLGINAWQSSNSGEGLPTGLHGIPRPGMHESLTYSQAQDHVLVPREGKRYDKHLTGCIDLPC
jgi:hypothetical protein